MNDSDVRHYAIVAISSIIAERARMNLVLSAFVVHVTIERFSKLVLALATRAREQLALTLIRR
jgi:hypothetical protein